MRAAGNPGIVGVEASSPPETLRRPHGSARNRVLLLAVGWLIVLLPFLFWHSTWFGRTLSDQQLVEYLHDENHPRHIQHALVQIGERIARLDHSSPYRATSGRGGDLDGVVNWYSDLVRLAASPVEEIRNTDAWVMGQDPTRPEFHEALLKMLHDESLLVRGNAALALVRFGDASGHDEIVALLRPTVLKSPQAGRVTEIVPAGTSVRQRGVVARLQSGDQAVEIRAPFNGRIRNVTVQRGEQAPAGAELAVLDPMSDQVWEALRALDMIGRPEDLAAVAPYLQPLPDMPNRIRQQAQSTDREIRARAGK